MSSFEHEIYEEALIPGTGHRIDFNLTDEDAVESVVVEIQAAELLAATAGSTALGGVVQVDNVVCPAFAALDDMDYFVLTDVAGLEWAAAAQKVPVAIAQDDDLQFAAVAGMTDGEYVIITDQSGTEWAIAADLTGASAAPTGARWGAVAPANKAQVDLSAAVTDEDVGDAFLAAFNLLVGFNAAVTLADELVDGLVSALQIVAGACALPETLLPDDSGVGSVVITQIVAGADASVEPTGAAWLAVPVAQRTFVDVSAAVTDEDVATAIDTALNLLAGFAAALTTDAVTTPGTIIVTQVARASVAVPVTYNFDDSAAGTFTTAVVAVGVDSNVDPIADTITVTPDPGWLTGRAVGYAATGALPDGLLGTTNGFVIRIAAGVYQIAATLADALAGTEVPLISQGAEGSTITITATAGINAYIFNSMKKLTDAELATAITTAQIFNVNNLQTISYSLGQVGLNFAVNFINQITLAPSLAVGPITLPAVLLPHFTIRVDAPTLRYSEIRITRRGIV